MRRTLFKSLLVGSLIVSALCAIAWPASYGCSIALKHIAPGENWELRLYEGSLYSTARSGGGTPAGWTVDVERAENSAPWPDLPRSRTEAVHDPDGALHWVSRPGGIDGTSFFGFNSVSYPIEISAVPCWAILLAMGLYQAWWRTRGQHLRRFPRGHCPDCGYDLKAIVDQRCPECGHRFGPGKVEAVPRRFKAVFAPRGALHRR
jgi:hypothetical protein